jgi:glucosamine kinase
VIAFVGVDAGGSHTEAAVAGPDLTPLGRHRGPSGRLDATIDDPATPIIAVVRTVCEQASVPLPATAAVIGAAGAGAQELRDRLRDALMLAGIAHRVAVTTDLEIAFCAAFDDGPGMLISAGTGSVAAARDEAGRFTKVGGYGWRVGDEGSAAALGRAALQAALRTEDRRGGTTALLDALRLQMHAQDRLGDVHLIRAAGPGDFAALVPTVIATAQAGDAVAAQLLVETVDALVRHVTALRVATGDGAGRTVALNGGLLAHDSVIRDTFVDQLARAHPDLRVRAEAVDPLRGALALAQRLEQVRAR